MVERRSEPRQRVLKIGKIVYNMNTCVFDCRIRDMTSRGARLRIEHSWEVPQHFTFVDISRGGVKSAAQVIWRGTGEVGVSFEQAA